MLSLNEALENLDIQDEPVILEIIEKLNSLTFKTDEPLEMVADISDVQLEIQPDIQTEIQTEIQPEIQPETQSESQIVIQSEIEVPTPNVIEVETVESEKPKPKKRGKRVVDTRQKCLYYSFGSRFFCDWIDLFYNDKKVL